MPSLSENKQHWHEYPWRNQGDEWSEPWGGVSSQWYSTIMPRIHHFMPAARILELGCGCGRWTAFLKDLCQDLVAVDVSELCIDLCGARFAGVPSIKCHLTDGLSLPMVLDASVDFVFSFDSLVHADRNVLESYMRELNRILTPNGVAFIHHSNLAEYRSVYPAVWKHRIAARLLMKVGLVEPYLHWRDRGVSATVVANLARDAGLKCVIQELLAWRTRFTLIDCVSTIVRDAVGDQPNRILRNPDFMKEVTHARRLSSLYGLPISLRMRS